MKKFKMIILVVIILVIGLIGFEKLTVKRYYNAVDKIYEKNGILYIEVSHATSMGYIYDCKLVDMGDNIYEVVTYSSLFSGRHLYEFDNKDGHIKEIRQYNRDGDYEVVYTKYPII